MSDPILLQVAARHGTPCYVYLGARIDERLAQLRRAFGDRLQLSYSVKANPNRALLRRLSAQVDYLDVSSGGELLVALEAGWDASALTFVGPAKEDWELALALERGGGQVVAESVGELRRLNELAASRAQSAPVMIRVNPVDIPKGFGVSMSSRATQFGIDEEELDAALEQLAALPHLQFNGFHIYAGTQCLDAFSITENFANYARIFREFSTRHGLRPHLLIFGGGLGIPYHPADRPLDLDAIAREVNPLLDDLREDAALREARCVLELGRYLVGEAGYYLASVVSTKSTRGREIAILDGGMNHHLAASGHLGSVIRRNYPIARVTPAAKGAATGEPPKYTLMGPLCTNIDMLGQNVDIGALVPGDVIAFGSSGAYGPTASPVHFITHPPPKEILLEPTSDGDRIIDVTPDGTLANPPNWT